MSNLTLKVQTYQFLLEMDDIGQVGVHDTWIPAGYGGQKVFFMLQHYSYHPNADLWPGMTLNRSQFGIGHLPYKGMKFDFLENYSAIGPLWPDLFALSDFSIVFQWRGHNFISDHGCLTLVQSGVVATTPTCKKISIRPIGIAWQESPKIFNYNPTFWESYTPVPIWP